MEELNNVGKLQLNRNSAANIKGHTQIYQSFFVLCKIILQIILNKCLMVQ